MFKRRKMIMSIKSYQDGFEKKRNTNLSLLFGYVKASKETSAKNRSECENHAA